MPKKTSKKPREYFHGKVEQAVHKTHGAFALGDQVKVLFSDPPVTGTIVKLIHGNFGQGRIYAEVDVDGHYRKYPLGQLRKI